jgi:hypothetical protein
MRRVRWRTNHLGKEDECMICCMTCHRDNHISDRISEMQRVIVEMITKGSNYGLQQGEALGCVG